MNHIATKDAALAVRPIGPTFGAEVAGMPINGDVSPELLAQFISFLHRYRVLVVPQANVGPRRPRGVQPPVRAAGNPQPVRQHPAEHREVFCVGNVGCASFSRGVEQWHADSSYRSLPSDASLFYGEIVPPEGGDTMFADATAAYRSLDPAMKQRIEGLVAVHSLETLRLWGQRHNPGRDQKIDSQAAQFPPVRQPLVRVHPVTGAKSLYVCRR